jgi:hypothetical protein
MKKIILSGLILLASSNLAFAQNVNFGTSGGFDKVGSVNPLSTKTAAENANSGNVRDLRSLIVFVIDYINQGIYLLMALATVFFVYNVVQYFVIKTDADRKEAGNYLMYSIIGFAVVLSFWGMVNVVIQTFSLDNNTKPNVQNLYFK